MFDIIQKMYEAVASGVAKKLSNTVNKYKITVYSMGKDNPTIRIDIKKED